MLRFSDANAKIQHLQYVEALKPYLLPRITGKRRVYSLDLLSGWSCPFAKDCLSKVVEREGKRTIKDGPHTQFRCFSASQEVAYPAVYDLRKRNYDALRNLSSDDMYRTILDSLPHNIGVNRIHVGGDFFNRDYMLAWHRVATSRPDVLFYAYTKSLRYLIDIQGEYGVLDNLVFTASRGGREDYLIDKHNLREAVVVFSEEQAYNKGLEIDHDDSHAADPSKRNESFALIIHGVQPKGSEASRALQILKKNNVRHSYSKRKEIA